MEKRRLFGIICYAIAIICYLVCGYITYLTYSTVISEMEGFLIFILVWIGSYWFSTFFSQLICVKSKDGKKNWLIKKGARRLMGDILAVLSAALICFWAFIYVSRYTSLLSFMNK